MDTEILTVHNRYSPTDRHTAIASFLRTFGANPSLDIEFSRIPQTNGKTVWLGDCSFPTQYFETLALGHGIHEMMHVRHTDFQKCLSLDPLTTKLLNLIEDLRLDRLGEKENPAYRLWRERLAASCLRLGRLRSQASNDQTSPAENLITWMHGEMCARGGYRWALDNIVQLRRTVLAIPAKCKNALLRECRRVETAKDTGESLKIAQKLRRILEDECHLQREAQTQRQQEEQNATASLFGQEEDKEKNEQPLSSADFLQQVLSTTPNLVAGTGGDGETDPGFAFAPGIDEAAPETRYRVSRWPKLSAKRMERSMRQEFVRSFEKASQNLPETIRAFADLLHTKDESAGSRFAHEGIEFRDDWLDTLASTDRRVFEVSAEGRSVNAEICVLLDRSGSMGVGTMTLAKLSVLSLVTVLSRLKGVTSTVSVFPGLTDKHVAIVKEAHESLEAFSAKVPGIDAFGSTPIFEAMHWAMDAFAPSRARDKLLLVITDGRFEPDRSRSIQTRLKHFGVELALMSIGIDNKEAADNHVLVKDPQEINDGLVTLLSHTTFAKAVCRKQA